MKSCLVSDSILRGLERFSSQESVTIFGGWDVRQVRKDFGYRWRGTAQTFTLHCAALYACMANNLGVICNGILGPKEDFPPLFFPKPSFWEPRESPNAATIIPLRGGSKLQGTAGLFSLPSFPDSVAFLLFPSFMWLGPGGHYFLGQEFAITVQ